jgi:hypothetical protein
MMETRSCRTLLFTLIGVLAVGGLLLVAQTASAQTCIQEVWKAHGNNQGLNCTAQDVTLSQATNIAIQTGGQCDPTTGKCQCFAGQPLTFTADFRMDLTADTRYDIGFYIATDGDPNGDGAITGQCTATASLVGNTPAGNFINLDTGTDVCGDITGPLGTAHNPIFVHQSISTQCPSAAGQQLRLPFCTTWRQPGSNQVCLGTGNGTTTNDVFPGSPSKCNCGTLVLDITSITTTIDVTKDALTASVPESGGSGTYSVKMKNNSTIAVTVTSLTDDKYGDITTTHAANASCTGSATPGVCQAVTATTCVPDGNTATCEVGGSIAPGAECSCTFTGTVPPGNFPGSFTDVVKGCANNATNPTPSCKTDDATIPYADVSVPPTLTKTASSTQCRVDVTYNVVVTNNSVDNPAGSGNGDTLTLNTLTDDVYGDITKVQGNVISTTCGQSPGPGTLPFVIAVGGNYSCSFVGRISSCSTTVKDTVTGGTVDQDGKSFTPSDDATVVITVTTP